MLRLLTRLLSPLVDPAVRACLAAASRQNETLRHERDMYKHQAGKLLRAAQSLVAHNNEARGRLISLEPTVVIQRPSP